MAEYIDREQVIDWFSEYLYTNQPVQPSVLLHDLKALPAADVAPVVHGKWTDKSTGRYGQMQSWCSTCGRNSGIGGIKSNQHKPYCPNCGAKMDLEEVSG